jgi:hypothetical protein
MSAALDFSALTDDQLLELLRAACQAAAARNPAIARAAEAIVLDEAERARIIAAAAEQEAAALRAAERERIAKEAREKVRAGAEAIDAARRANDAARQSAAAKKGQEAAEAERRRAERNKGWLSRAAALVDADPQKISLIYTDTQYGSRVLINDGYDRYARDHLADYNTSKATTKTPQTLVKRKPEIAALCAEFAATFKLGSQMRGCDYDWERAT